MNNKAKILLTVVLLMLAAGSVSACNTMEGFGRDLEAAGEGIQDETR